MGVPSKYTNELGEKLFKLITTTSLSLRNICKQCDISHSIVRDWISDKKHPFSDLYARGKEIQIALLAEEILDISDDGSNDLMLLTKPNGEQYEAENKEVVNRSKLRVDSRKWLLSKLKPKIYGDKIELSGDADNPIQVITGMRINP